MLVRWICQSRRQSASVGPRFRRPCKEYRSGARCRVLAADGVTQLRAIEANELGVRTGKVGLRVAPRQEQPGRGWNEVTRTHQTERGQLLMDGAVVLLQHVLGDELRQDLVPKPVGLPKDVVQCLRARATRWSQRRDKYLRLDLEVASSASSITAPQLVPAC